MLIRQTKIISDLKEKQNNKSNYNWIIDIFNMLNGKDSDLNDINEIKIFIEESISKLLSNNSHWMKFDDKNKNFQNSPPEYRPSPVKLNNELNLSFEKMTLN